MDFNDNDIVISGISGRFPNSNNLREFSHNLFNKIDMVDDDESRWKHVIPNIPKRFGKIRNLEKFDASFFATLNKHAKFTDPQMRMLLEHSYEAILDAGVSPQSLIGTRTGVFIASGGSEAKDVFVHRVPAKDGYLILGNANFYLSNRISYALGLCGPSFTVDAACSSSAYALDCAFHYMETGLCDAALVGGTQLILTNGLSEYTKLGVLSADGISRPFDENASGFVRAETVCVIFLQKFKDSKRIYANVVYSSSNNDGFKEEGISFPSRELQQRLMEEFYQKVSVDPLKINFVEAHSTGTRLGDPEEVASIDEVFSKNKIRSKQLIIGSVKSNMGHSEAASGMSSIAKVLVAFENQQFPPNINLNNPRTDIEAFADGRIKVATDIEPLDGEYIAMNSFGLGGANAHALLRGNTKAKINSGIPDDNFGRMIFWSGRTEAAVNAIFNDITKRPLDAEHIALLQNSQTITTGSNTYRGYGMFINDATENKAVCTKRSIQYFNGTRRPIVFVYSGIGSQWIEMGRNLMDISLFADSIEKSHNILVKKGIDLKKIITSADEATFDNVMHSYVGIVAIEIALTDILKALNIVPDFIIGHSLGEVSCAYADNCFTAEEAILAAHARGEACCQTQSVNGAMAAVGLNIKQLEYILPEDIDIACHNGEDSTTISGPAESINAVVEKLKDEKIFAKAVASSGVALHSRYILDMGKKLNEKLKDIIKDPKLRSSKWLSSTYPEDMWNEQEACYSSAEYHTKNLLNPVLFLEVCDKLPKNALTLEVAPHGLLKAILKRNLRSGVHVSLTQKDCANGVEYFMESLGSLFQHGVDMDISKLYPAISFPVSRGTPMISPVIKWNHEIDHFVPLYDTYNTFERTNLFLNINDKNFEFMQGNVVNGQYQFAESSFLVLVWETYSRMINCFFEKNRVVFEDIHFTRSFPMQKNMDYLITISIHRGTGRFEVIYENEAIVYGFIYNVKYIDMSDIIVPSDKNAIMLTTDDFYKETREKGYFHLDKFQSVKEIRHDGLKGKLNWIFLWHTFIDGMLQVYFKQSKRLTRPTSIRKLVIDPVLHHNMLGFVYYELTKVESDSVIETVSQLNFDVVVCPHLKVVKAGGVEIHEPSSIEVPRKRQKDPIIEIHDFVPYFSDKEYSLMDAAKILTQIAVANMMQHKTLFLEVDSIDDKQPLCKYFSDALRGNPHCLSDVTLLTSKQDIRIENVRNSSDELSSFSGINMILARNCIGNDEFFETAKSVLLTGGYIFSIEDEAITEIPHPNVLLVARIPTGNEFIHMLKFRDNPKIPNPEAVIEVTSDINKWLEPLQNALKNEQAVIYAYNNEPSGLMGFVNCIRREYSADSLKCFFIMDRQNAPLVFDINHPFYKSQLDLNHSINIFKDGKWGSYRHIDMPFDINSRTQSQHCLASCLIKGHTSSLSWISGPLKVTSSDMDIINVQYAAINDKDIEFVAGKDSCNSDELIEHQKLLGLEFAGIRRNGDRVMGISHKYGAIATHVNAKYSICWKVPDSWTLEDAATVPIAYYIVYSALFSSGTLKSGKSILIHSGSDDLGQAAIEVALAYGLEVFTTVNSEKNKRFLTKKYPQLNMKNIGTTRNIKFEKMIYKNTNGRGVDYVFNTLSGDKLHASIRCVAKDGVFMDVGDHDMSGIDTRVLKKRISVKSIDFEELLDDSEGNKAVHDLIEKDLASGIIKPLSRTVFNADDIKEAFSYAKTEQRTDKVLLKIRQNENDESSLPMPVQQKVYFDSNESVIVTGGLGGFGMEMTEWLVSKGCRKMVLSSSKGFRNAYQQQKVESLKSRGVTVTISTSNICTESGCKELIKQAIKLGPVAGIFNLAGVLRDGIFENLDTQMFEDVLAPKGPSTLFLDKLSRILCPKLRHFVLFSSVSSGRGYAGKGNYGLANSIMERVAEKRCEEGLPGKAIQWGAVGIGMLEDFQLKYVDDLYIGGMYPQTLQSCFEVYDSLLTSDAPVVSSMVKADQHMDDVKRRNIVDIILNIMGIRDKKSISMDSTFTQLGIDSLMGVEIQQVCEREYNVYLKSQEIRSMTINQLEKCIATKGINNKDIKMLTEDVDGDKGFKLSIDDIADLNTFDPSKTIVKANDIVHFKNTRILILPWIFGFATKDYKSLAQQMEYPAYILQLSDISDYTDLDEITRKLTPSILELFSDVNSFILIGHSFGALLALKIAKILEDNRKSGQIIQLDGSPQFCSRYARKMLNQGNFSDIKDFISMLLFEHYQAQIDINLASILLEKSDDWETRTKELMSTFSYKIPSTWMYLLTNLPSEFTNRLNISLSTKESDFCALKNTRISLVKPTNSSINGIHRDYGLTQFATSNVRIMVVEGDHETMIRNVELAGIVKELID
ncbi:fatty acid synthase-like [Chironomus tepperi]|uniref:fatty acid synthase-like n=1 Tax=Chironomus tepperi TaxID=113505 RepID=UPI00391FBD55